MRPLGDRPWARLGEGRRAEEHTGLGLGRVGVGCSLVVGMGCGSLLEAGEEECGIGVRVEGVRRMVLGVRRILVRAGVVHRSPVGEGLVGVHRSRAEEDIGLEEGLEGGRIVAGDSLREVVGDIEAVARSGPEEEADRMRHSLGAVLDMQVNTNYTIALFKWGRVCGVGSLTLWRVLIGHVYSLLAIVRGVIDKGMNQGQREPTG